MSPQPDLSGFRDGASGANHVAALEFAIRRVLSGVRTATIVKVLAVTNSGGVTPVGTVDVQPLVSQVDGSGNVIDLPKLYGLPYMRVQGGSDAVILDPKVGDLGIALFGDRDLSNVIANKAKSAPGSKRKHSLSDGLYIGGILNGTPTQYVQFSTSGMTLVSPNKITLQAPNVEIDASTQFKVTSAAIEEDGPVHITGAQTNDSTLGVSGQTTLAGVTSNGKDVGSTHKHSGVTTGSGDTGTPV